MWIRNLCYNAFMSKILRLHTLLKDEKILRAPNQELGFPLSKDMRKLIDDMLLTARKAPGIGLAAPQVGQNLMLAIINLEEMGIPPFVIINPKIVSKSIKKTLMEEGCLSIPGRFGLVKRPAKIQVEAQNAAGKKIIIKADRLLAKVLQHEIDHLNGILIEDKFVKQKQ